MIKQIWDELVVNSLIEAETSYFKKWFVQFTGKEAEHIFDSTVLCQFFYAEVTLLYQGSVANKKELLKTFTEIFFRINLLRGLLLEQIVTLEDHYGSVVSEANKVTIYVLVSSPEELEGIDALWKVLEMTEDDETASDLIETLTKLYVRTEVDKQGRILEFREYLKSFLDRCYKIHEAIVAKQDWINDFSSVRSLKRLLMLLIEIVDVSESIYAVANRSLSNFYRGEKVPLSIENKIKTYRATSKLELKVYANTTVLQLKKKIVADISKVSWKDVKLTRQNKKPEIKDKYNSRTLRDMRIRLGEKLVAESKPVFQKASESLVIDNRTLNPRAEAAFREVFRRYAKDGVMTPTDTIEFIQVVLEQKGVTAEDPKIKDLFERYDVDKDGRLQEDDFVEFYKASALGPKHKAVKDNLRTLGYGEDLVLNTDDEPYTEEDLARFYIIQNDELLLQLFNLTDREDDLGKSAWDLFIRLPPIPSIIQKLLRFEGLDREKQNNWNELIDASSVYKTMYYLYIIDYLIEESEETTDSLLEEYIDSDFVSFKTNWRNEFIKYGGFVHLLKILTTFIHKGINSRTELVLFSFLMKSVTNYILASVTLNNPLIYRNVAFITNAGISLETLIGKKPDSEEKGEASKKPVKDIIDTTHENGVSAEENPHSAAAAPVTPAPQTAEAQKEETAQKALEARLYESEDFIQFRESLRQAGDDSISKLDLEETLRFMATLSENLLSKTGSVEFEEINIVKLSLSIFFSLLLNHNDFLQRAVTTQEVVLLPANSTFRIKGYSDLVSFFMAGLLTKRNFLLVRYFNNAFTVVMRESGSVEVQTILIRAILDHVVRDDLAPRDVAKYIDLASTILETVCSQDRDPKILLTKSDINKIANLETMFFKILDVLLDSKDSEPGENEYQNDLMIGYFKILEKLLALEPKLKQEIHKRKEKDYIGRIFRECLFNLDGKTQPGVALEDSVKCKNTVTRSTCFDFLAETCKGTLDNSIALLDEGLDELCSKLPVIPGWRYTPSKDKKSPLGFLGIYNLRCICYINAMLQQFYMTPAFRYSVLASDDMKPPAISEDKDGRKIDDNVLHQLQKLFAYLDKSERAYYTPYDFIFSFKDPSGEPTNVAIQQDTQEFLNIFFDRIENLLKPTPFKNILNNVYGGKTIDLLGCTSCGHLRVTEQIFYNLSMEVKNMKNMKESLDKLTSEDVISDFKCENCQQKCDVTKRPLIKDCPNVLIVYLSRMIFDLDVLMNVKINSRFEFPLNMNLKDYTYDNYLHEKSKNEKGSGNPESSDLNASEKMTEDISGSIEKPLEPTKDVSGEGNKDQPQLASVPKELQDEDYEYNLAGVLVHMGHAEGGHYYSYINVNRNDPRRTKK